MISISIISIIVSSILICTITCIPADLALNKILEGIAAANGYGGCEISVYKQGEAIFNYGTGIINIDSTIDIMRIASLSKSFAAVSILQLIEDNDMGITLNSTIYDVIKNDQEILSIFESFSTLSTYIDNIRISDLLSMRGGFRHYEEPFEYYWHYDDNDTNSILYDKLSLFGDDPLYREPRSGYKYSSFGYGIIGILIEVISGKSFYQYVNDNIVEIIGLTNTGNMNNINSSRYVLQTERQCTLNNRGYKILTDCISNNTFSNNYYDQVVWYKTSAGGLLSNTLDLCKYTDNLIWDRDNINLLNNEMYLEMFRGQTYVKTLTDGREDWYGFGWHMYGKNNPNYIWHTGGAIGGVARLTITKDIQLIVAVNCNGQSGQTGITEIADFVEEYFSVYTPSDEQSVAKRARGHSFMTMCYTVFFIFLYSLFI